MVSVLITSILILGDSHTARDFGQYLEAELSKKTQVTVYAAEGSKPSSWLDGENIWGYAFKLPNQKWDYSKNRNYKYAIPKLSEILALSSSLYNPPQALSQNLSEATIPNTVVIALGSNGADRAYQLAKLITSSGKNCIWITPPPMLSWMDNKPNLILERNNEILQNVGKICKVIISSDLEVFQTPIQKSEMSDEIHFNKRAPKAKKWAIEVAQKIFSSESINLH